MLVCPARQLVRIPEGVSFEDAAALQVAFATAWHMLFSRAELMAGETVLINSVGSGIGSAAVQLARRAGAFVIGNASSRREAGAGPGARAGRGHQPPDARTSSDG